MQTDYREKCLREKPAVCHNRECGSTDNIQVHHIDGDRTNNSLSNLIPLCERCHRKIHSGGFDGKLTDKVVDISPSDGIYISPDQAAKLEALNPAAFLNAPETLIENAIDEYIIRVRARY